MKSSTILVLAASLLAASAGHAGETPVASQPAQVLGVKLAAMNPGARIAVLGAGPIGLAAIYWARRLGAAAAARDR